MPRRHFRPALLVLAGPSPISSGTGAQKGEEKGGDQGSSRAVGQGGEYRSLGHQGIGKMKDSDIRHAVGVRVCFTQYLVIFKNNFTYKCSHFKTLTSK